MSNWMDQSEIVAGLVLRSVTEPKSKLKLSAESVNPLSLCPPYNSIIPLVRDGLDIAAISLNNSVGVEAVNAALNAAGVLNDAIPPVQWLKNCEKIAASAVAGTRLSKIAKALENGEEIPDIGDVMKIISDLEMGYQNLVPMSEVKEQEANWIQTGYAPWDENFKGIPAASLTIIGASPGVGKTSLMLELCKSMVLRKENAKKKIAIFTLEMTMAQITKRMLDLTKLKKEDKARILLGDGSYNVNEIYAQASRVASSENLALIAIDFADLLVEDDQTEAIMGKIYRTLAQLAKKTGVPVILLSQLSRAAYELGGMPRIHHLRYSGLAEAMAALIILLYNPKNIAINVNDKGILPVAQGKGYLIAGKSRYGYVHGGPGAVLVDWDGEGGWGKKGLGWWNV